MGLGHFVIPAQAGIQGLYPFLLSYYEVGLLLNFGRKPEFKRFVYDNKRKNISDDQRRSVAE